jgi:hypothetical protein
MPAACRPDRRHPVVPGLDGEPVWQAAAAPGPAPRALGSPGGWLLLFPLLREPGPLLLVLGGFLLGLRERVRRLVVAHLLTTNLDVWVRHQHLLGRLDSYFLAGGRHPQPADVGRDQAADRQRPPMSPQPGARTVGHASSTTLCLRTAGFMTAAVAMIVADRLDLRPPT